MIQQLAKLTSPTLLPEASQSGGVGDRILVDSVQNGQVPIITNQAHTVPLS